MPCSIKHQTTLFADDLSVIIPHQNKNENYEHELNNTVDLVNNWLSANGLSVNPHKTNYIHFRNYKTEQLNLNIKINGHLIEKTNETKFLGIILDEHCNWKSHIQNVNKKLNSFVFALKRLKNIYCITSLSRICGFGFEIKVDFVGQLYQYQRDIYNTKEMY